MYIYAYTYVYMFILDEGSALEVVFAALISIWLHLGLIWTIEVTLVASLR